MIPKSYAILPFLILLAACGNKERDEAVLLSKTLNEKKPEFAKINALENEFLSAAKSWCSPIVTTGAGKQGDVASLADTGVTLGESAATVSTSVGAFRKSLADMSLMQEGTASIRSSLVDLLANRQRSLYELKTMLDASAGALRSMSKEKDYKPDSFPDEISKLNDKLLSYRVREGILDDALTQLKENYDLE
jgi:hypothetical protein